MKYATIKLITLLAFFLGGCASHTVYLNDHFEEIKKNHHTIAILPFAIHFENPYLKTKKPSINFGKRELEASLDSQKEMFMHIAKQIEKGNYEFSLQNFTKTNQILKEQNISIDTIELQNKGYLAQILGVDAVIFSDLSITISQLYSSMYPAMPNPTFRIRDGATLQIKIFDAKSEEMLWSNEFSNQPNHPLDTPHQLASSLIRSSTKSLPYKNK